MDLVNEKLVIELFNEKLLIELYSEYINDSQYVYYKEHDTIIIMKKLIDNYKCISDIIPKKYHSDSLKVILMFNKDDPYKLVSSTTKYKMNELVESNYYESIKEAYNLKQLYYESGQLRSEYNYINKQNKLCGLCQDYYESGQLMIKYNYIDGKIQGLCQYYYESGQPAIEYNYIDGLRNGLYQEYYENGQIKETCYYENGKIKN